MLKLFVDIGVTAEELSKYVRLEPNPAFATTPGPERSTVTPTAPTSTASASAPSALAASASASASAAAATMQSRKYGGKPVKRLRLAAAVMGSSVAAAVVASSVADIAGPHKRRPQRKRHGNRQAWLEQKMAAAAAATSAAHQAASSIL